MLRRALSFLFLCERVLRNLAGSEREGEVITLNWGEDLKRAQAWKVVL